MKLRHSTGDPKPDLGHPPAENGGGLSRDDSVRSGHDTQFKAPQEYPQGRQKVARLGLQKMRNLAGGARGCTGVRGEILWSLRLSPGMTAEAPKSADGFMRTRGGMGPGAAIR